VGGARGGGGGRPAGGGGRVWASRFLADTLPEAIAAAYEIAGQVRFENSYCRRDIGARALAAKEG
jgi:Phosphoribosylamine-glycine ligase